MAAVVALIHGEAGAYGISFPDFQGTVSGGVTMDEALRRGAAMLAVHIEALAADGDPLPDIRTIDEIKADPTFAEDLADAVTVALLEAEVSGRSVRPNISLDERLVERIDKRAREIGESRSGFLAAAARQRLAS